MDIDPTSVLDQPAAAAGDSDGRNLNRGKRRLGTIAADRKSSRLPGQIDWHALGNRKRMSRLSPVFTVQPYLSAAYFGRRQLQHLNPYGRTPAFN